jgi:beta-lactam-binding protein with PASTA domain
MCVVPKLSGRKLKGARKGLAASHCKLGKVVRKGRGAKHVVAQSPKAGKTLPAGSAVGVTLDG